MSALPKRFFTPEEYLLLEERSPYKSQYIGGEIFPMGEDTTSPPSMMGGAAPNHAVITTAIGALLYLQFRGRPCQVFSSDIRVAVEPGDIYTYPDVVALCAAPQYETTRPPASLLNPQLIVEVLSPSTEAYDRGDKFAYYQRLACLTDYVLVAADQMRVEHYARREGGWHLTIHARPADRLVFSSLEAELLLAEIYDKVDLPAPRGVRPA